MLNAIDRNSATNPSMAELKLLSSSDTGNLDVVLSMLTGLSVLAVASLRNSNFEKPAPIATFSVSNRAANFWKSVLSRILKALFS